MFSQTTEYAIRALIEIATRPEGEQVLAGELAESLNIPQHYLSKLLQQLVRTRVLKSVRGRNGGFSLSRPAAKVCLREVVEPFEDLKKFEDCILGQKVCSDAGACPLHEFWKNVRERYLEELDSKTLQDLSTYQLRRLDSMKAGLLKRVGSVPGKVSMRAKATRAKPAKAKATRDKRKP
ncbi:MAG: Rrf2 family transcriptional regulator [Planctomycetes bacterium]|nr:Rrf2 family transcriptional regulator [Planctomycetota bacterium]MCA8937339.1 Rrf2 family transcriptional regulator [Planctomycetota bacterium]